MSRAGMGLSRMGGRAGKDFPVPRVTPLPSPEGRRPEGWVLGSSRGPENPYPPDRPYGNVIPIWLNLREKMVKN